MKSPHLGGKTNKGTTDAGRYSILSKTILPILPILCTMTLTVPIWGIYHLLYPASGIKPFAQVGGLSRSGRTAGIAGGSDE